MLPNKYIYKILSLLLWVSFSATAQNSTSTSTSTSTSIIKILKSTNNDTIKINTLNRMAYKLSMTHPDSCLLLARHAYNLAILNKFLHGKITALENMGLGYAQKGEFKPAYDNYRKAVDMYETLGDQSGIASSYCNLGDLFLNQSDYSRAMEYFFKAIKISEQIKDKINLAKNLGNAGIVFYYQGEYPKALNYYFKAMKIFEELIHENKVKENSEKIRKYKNGIARYFTNIGVVYYEQDQFSKAMDYFYKALKIKEELGDKHGIAGNLLNLGNLYLDHKEYDKALENYSKALKISEEIGDKFGIANNYGNIATVYQKLKEVKKMFEYYQKAIKMQEEIGDKNGVCVNTGRLGNFYMNEGQFKLAEIYLKRGLSISDTIGTLGNSRLFSERLSSLYLDNGLNEYKSGNYKYAADQFLLSLEYVKKAFTIKDSLFNQDKSKEIGRLEAKHEIEIGEMERKKAETERLRKINEDTSRRNILQYSGIFIFILALGIMALFTGRLKISIKLTEGIIFFMFLLFFEFILVLLDPYSDSITHDVPIYKLLFNAIIAALIFPAHAYLEKKIMRRIHFPDYHFL